MELDTQLDTIYPLLVVIGILLVHFFRIVYSTENHRKNEQKFDHFKAPLELVPRTMNLVHRLSFDFLEPLSKPGLESYVHGLSGLSKLPQMNSDFGL